MTEYWVSQGNKWCDYCKIYIANNAASIRTHEVGTRHKESVAQKLNSIRKDNAAKEKEKEMALKDLGRIETKAMQSYERDLAARRRSDAVVEGPENAPGKRIAQETGSASLHAESRIDKPAPQVSRDKLKSSAVVGKASNTLVKNRGPAKSSKGVASSLAVGKRKRVEKTRPTSSEETAALAAREAARKRTQEREKALLGLYQAY